MTHTATWKELLQRALAESDPERQVERIREARTAIMDRIEQLLDDPERLPEHDEILRALNTLDSLTNRFGTDAA